MGSSGHRANILSASYNAVGIAVVEEKGKIHVTQDFIFLVPNCSESQFNAAFAEAFNLARKSKGIRPLQARDDTTLHDPHHLPPGINPRVANPDFHLMKYGACFRPDQEHGYANFWVVATFTD
jgi:hypothetical protein